VLTGTALLFSAPAFASTHYIDHHTAHTLRTAYHHGAAQHELAQHAVLHHVSYHVRHHTALQATSATYYDDGAGYHTALPHHHYYRRTRYAHFLHSGLQCVPYAREISHIELSGDAFLWWAEASGRYARGNVPAEGAVLNFRAIGRMPLGHVAVVTAVEDSRTILVTQANWVRGSITNDVTVQDVSPNNDWSQVEVELGDSSTWGASYPIYGFIYNHPDTGTVIAANGQGNEVAEAPAVTQVSDEAPDRNLQ
jgi:surface antigen